MRSASACALLDTIRREKERGVHRLKAVGRTVLRTLRREGGITPEQLRDAAALSAGARFRYTVHPHCLPFAMVSP